MKKITHHLFFGVFGTLIVVASVLGFKPMQAAANPFIPIGGLGAITQNGNFLYASYQNSNTVSVIDTTTNKVVAVIPVGNGPQNSSVVGGYLYVDNNTDGTVSVIDTSTNMVTATLTVGSEPAGSLVVGTNIYINDSRSNQVSVIDTTNNSVTNISVGRNPNSLAVSGTNVYVMNSDDGTVSVIDTTKNIVTDTIPVGNNDTTAVAVGTNLYVSNQDDGTISVIDTTTNMVTNTITVGSGPGNATVVGQYLYINDLGGGQVSVVDTNTNTLVTNITVAANPFTSTLAGTNLYVNNFGSTSVDVIDTTTNTVIASIPVGGPSAFSKLVGTNLYVVAGIPGVVVIDTTTNTTVPVPPPLLSSADISSSTLALNYDEVLDRASIPNPNDFVVDVNSAPVAVTSVQISDKMVTLTLASPVANGDVVEVSYTPGSNPTRDLTSDNAASFTNQSVVNNTPAGTPPTVLNVTPADGAVNQSMTAPLVINFSEAMNENDVVIASSPCGGNGCPTYDNAWSNGDTTLNLTKTGGPFEYNTLYSIEVYSAQSASGLPLSSSYRWSFTTGSAPVVSNSNRIISGGIAAQICTDPKALNYQSSFGVSNPATCKYSNAVTPTASNTIASSGSSTSSALSSQTILSITRTLKYGTKGADVLLLQKYLNTHSYVITQTGAGSLGHETASFGLLTKKAVQKFQKDHGLTPDGVVGSKTRALMN